MLATVICIRPIYLIRLHVQYKTIYPDAGYPDCLGRSGKHFYCIRTASFYGLKFSRNYPIHTRTNTMFYLYVNKYVA